MLQSIRDRTQGWIAGIIVSILIISFALWGIHSYFMGAALNTSVAEVNGIEITKGQLAIAYERLRHQMQAQFGSNAELLSNAESGLKDRALQGLIDIQVLKQASLKQRYFISQNQVNSFLENMSEFQVEGQFSYPRFQQVLSTTMYTSGEFLDLIKTSLLIDQPRLGTIYTSFALPNEVNDAIALVDQERDLQYVILPNQFFANQAITVTESAVNDYYQQHLSEFKTPEKVSVDYLQLTANDLINKVKITDEDIKSFYNENSNAFAQQAQWKLDTIVIPVSSNATDEEVSQAKNKMNDIAEKAKEGIDFSALSRHYSLGHSNELSQKWVTQSQVPADLQKTLLTLTKSGEISNPIRLNNGFVLLKVTDFKEPELMPFDKVKDKVKESLLHQKSQEMFVNVREKLANLTYEHPESLQTAAQELGLPIKTSELFTKEKGGKDISSNSKVREIAFSNDVLNSQNNSDIIQINSDTVAVIRVKSHVPTTLLSLKTVQQQITDKLKTNEIDNKTKEVASDIMKKLAEGANPDSLIQQYQMVWNNTGFISRHSTKVDPAILDAAFETAKPNADKVSYAIAKVSNGYAIIALKAVKSGQSNDSEEYNAYADQIQNSQGLFEYELYKQSMMNQAKIVN